MTESFQFGLDTLLIVSVVQFGLGALAFWLFAGQTRPEATPANVDMSELEAMREKHRDDAKRIEEAMKQIHRLTGRIGHDVGEHNAEVKEINDALADASRGDTAGLESSLMAAVAKMTEANEKLQGELRQAEAKLAEQSVALESQMAMARTDALTGVLNRRAFDDELARRVGEFQRYRTPVSLMMFDIDHFKKFNDTYGHQTGDDVLCHVACTLSMVMRDVDLVCRYGGEEFAVILPGTELAGAELAAERARAAIERMVVDAGGRELRVTASGGVATALAGEDAEKLVARADQGLYASKKTGRNRVHVHDGSRLVHRGQPSTVAAEAKNETKAPEEGQSDSSNKKLAKVEPAAEGGATRDPLQSLPNREAFIEDVRRRVEQHYRYQSPVTILYCGVDGFSEIVARHGHEAGNVVLRAVAQFLRAVLRDHDIPARVSDDRFAIVLAGVDGPDAAAKAERIRLAVEKCKLPVDGLDSLRFTSSFGLAEIEDGDDADALMVRGTKAFAAAAAKGNRVYVEHEGALRPTELIATEL